MDSTTIKDVFYARIFFLTKDSTPDELTTDGNAAANRQAVMTEVKDDYFCPRVYNNWVQVV